MQLNSILICCGFSPTSLPIPQLLESLNIFTSDISANQESEVGMKWRQQSIFKKKKPLRNT